MKIDKQLLLNAINDVEGDDIEISVDVSTGDGGYDRRAFVTEVIGVDCGTVLMLGRLNFSGAKL